MVYPFRGWDFTELLEKWGIVIPDEDALDGDWVALKLYLENFVWRINGWGELSRVGCAAAKDIREYCRAMSQYDYGYWTPLWRGLSEIEDDLTTLQAFIPLAGHAWT